MTKLEQQQFDILAEPLDKQTAVIKELSEFKAKHKFLPPLYEADEIVKLNLEAYEKLGSWRNQPRQLAKIKMAAKLAARNKRKQTASNSTSK